VPPQVPDHRTQDRADQEADPPGDVQLDLVEQDERAQGADDRAAPVGAVDADVDPAGIISSMAELMAAYSPPMPAPATNRVT
jgi:hypothetical protein